MDDELREELDAAVRRYTNGEFSMEADREMYGVPNPHQLWPLNRAIEKQKAALEEQNS